MNAFTVETDLNNNSIKHIQRIDITSNSIKPIRSISVQNTIHTVLSRQHFNAEKNIEVSNSCTMNQIISPSLQITINQNNSGFIMPDENYNDDLYCLRGDFNNCSDLHVLDGNTLYVNLDNLINIANRLSEDDNISVSVYYDTDSYISIAIYYDSIDIEIFDSKKNYYYVYGTNKSDDSWTSWFYRPDWGDPEPLPQAITSNNMNVSISITSINDGDSFVIEYDSLDVQIDMDKTVISSYPFDCSNMTEGLDLFNVFYNTNGIHGDWTYDPETHVITS